MTNSRPYTKVGRLSEVLALIQVLGLDPYTHRSEKRLHTELQRPPMSASTWTDIASDHPEFFRVSESGEHPISLIARHVVPRDDERRKPKLEPEELHAMFTIALDLHDRQRQMADWWKHWLPILAASAITGTASVLAVLFTRWC